MRRICKYIFLVSLGLIACRAVNVVVPTPILTATPTAALPSPTATPQPTTTATAVPPTDTLTPLPPTPIASPTPTSLAFEVRTHPDQGLYVGDLVSFEIIAPAGLDLDAVVFNISDGSGDAVIPLEARFAPFGIGERYQATFYWAWDTADFGVGAQSLDFVIQPLGYTWTHTVTLGSAAEIPPPEPLARWASDESDCCVFYYITETAAAREITNTLAIADQLTQQAIQALEIDFTQPLVVTLMPRVLGQGGFASSEMYISFLDRNYAGNDPTMVLHHEMIHVLDQRLGGELRPSILIEGLAVYLTGGHYKPEPLIPRAAALLAPEERSDGLGLDWYLPLRPLTDDFYTAQHEIGYIQAGALVAYMVDAWGWDAFSAFYRDIYSVEAGTQSAALDDALQRHFGLTLETLESDFLTMLKAVEIMPSVVDDVRLTVAFFETMRRYQQLLDPSAYFLTAWLPNGPFMREQGIVADLLRRPSTIENLALETVLVAADAATDRGDYAVANEALLAANAVLEALEMGQSAPFDVHPLAQGHYQIARYLSEAGYFVEQIEVNGEAAQVFASQGWPALTFFEFRITDGNWLLVSGQP